jgi:hypothetical protein
LIAGKNNILKSLTIHAKSEHILPRIINFRKISGSSFLARIIVCFIKNNKMHTFKVKDTEVTKKIK